jgi:hypothetical protein
VMEPQPPSGKGPAVEPGQEEQERDAHQLVVGG